MTERDIERVRRRSNHGGSAIGVAFPTRMLNYEGSWNGTSRQFRTAAPGKTRSHFSSPELTFVSRFPLDGFVAFRANRQRALSYGAAKGEEDAYMKPIEAMHASPLDPTTSGVILSPTHNQGVYALVRRQWWNIAMFDPDQDSVALGQGT
jgi:hypothetical protein